MREALGLLTLPVEEDLHITAGDGISYAEARETLGQELAGQGLMDLA